MQHIFGSYTHKDIVWLDLLLKVLAGLIVVFGIYKLVRSKFWLTAKSEPDFQKTMAPWIGEAWNELSYRQMLEQAVAENDFKLAIRIRYGGLLHLMDEKGSPLGELPRQRVRGLCAEANKKRPSPSAQKSCAATSPKGEAKILFSP